MAEVSSIRDALDGYKVHALSLTNELYRNGLSAATRTDDDSRLRRKRGIPYRHLPNVLCIHNTQPSRRRRHGLKHAPNETMAGGIDRMTR
ncbi:hypothetical protein K523DRAFT_163236 [Schizophyllum commune Tattone D]|nr:hypothetical protein K523DRAFT_163236 [Schizophyllum commune Tattone D]